LVLSSPEFYPDDAFIDPDEAGLPMAITVVKHKYFDHDANATSAAQPAPQQDFELVGDDESPHKLTTRKDRLGAGAFRDSLLSAYGGACCVTGETSAEVLEAAHIEPYVNAGSNHVQNGLLLRVDIHRLFDAGLLTLDDDFTLRISPRLRSPAYQALNGRRLTLPLDTTARPSVVAIQAHRGAKRRQ
jgi:putative restriction endonuclease